MASNANRILLSAPVTVVYGVEPGLFDINGLNPLRVNEFVFLRMDFLGWVPKTGWNVG